MSDFDSGLPIRTQNNGDAVIRIVDGTLTTQFLTIDSSGRIVVKLTDGSGNAITSQVNGSQRALDVGINVAGVQVDPRQIRALTAADVVSANQGTAASSSGAWPIKITDGVSVMAVKAASTAAVATDPSAVVALSPNSPLPAGTNLLGSVNQGTSPWVTKDQADGPVAPGTAASFSELIGGQFNTALPTLTNGQQSAVQVDASGRIIVAQSTASALQTTARLNDGAGNAITSAVAGSTRPLDVAQRDANGNLYSATNPFPVAITSDKIGTEVINYNTAAAVAAGSASNHDYTVTTAKTLLLSQIEASASGKAKIEIQIESGVATNTFTTKAVQFNSTASPNMSIHFDSEIAVAAGVRVRIIRTNRDLLPQDVYSTVVGQEVP